jgi:peptidoglycan/LPS O-acetylase OafA/YrhL
VSIELYSIPAAVAAFVLAWFAGWLLLKLGAAPPASGRFASIDGMRGFLAFAVFLHHGAIWFSYVRTGIWGVLDSSLFAHFGQGAVSLFFMITAFLFTSKIVTAERGKIDWIRLYVGRLTRLFPMYAVAVGLMWLMAWQLAAWRLQVPLLELGQEALGWATFTIPGTLPVNGNPDANLLMAGVTWTLPYEWWFYLSLPLIALIARRTRLSWWVGFAAVSVLLTQVGYNLVLVSIWPFLGGVAGAFAARIPAIRKVAGHWSSGLVVIACIGSAVIFFPTAYTPPATALYSVAFILIASGSSVFGLLTSPASRMLGETTYSIYLIHGLLLTVLFRYLLGFPAAASLTTTQHWFLLLALVFPLVGLSYLTFRWIETPAMNLTPKITDWLHRPRPRRTTTPMGPTTDNALT